MALIINDTSMRKLMPSTIVNEIKRCLKKYLQKRPGIGCTPQTRFSAVCNSPKTLEAPMRSTTILTTLAAKLEVVSVQTELRKLPGSAVCYRLAFGCPRPTVTAAGMLELKIAAVFKVKQRLGEAGIYGVSSRLCFGEIGQHMETRPVTKLARGSQYISGLLCRIEHFHGGFRIARAGDPK